MAIPKTIYFNLRYLPFKQGWKLPIWITNDTLIDIRGGRIMISSPIKTAMIRIGFHTVPVIKPKDRTVLRIRKNALLIFHGTAHIGKGTIIAVNNSGVMELGENFAVSASSQFNCYKHIVIGENVQFSWDCLIMDSDTHDITDINGSITNYPKEIFIGNKVLIFCRTMILKGSYISDNCVVGAQSLIAGKKYEPNSLIAGNPGRCIKKIGGWNL